MANGYAPMPWDQPTLGVDPLAAPQVAGLAPMPVEQVPQDWGLGVDPLAPPDVEWPPRHWSDQADEQKLALDQVDAISGGSLPNRPPLQKPASDMQPIEAYPEQAAFESEQSRLQGLDPEALAVEQADLEYRRKLKADADSLAAVTRDEEAAVQNYNDFRTSVADVEQRMQTLDAEAQELSKQGLDNDRWWNSRSTGQQVATFLSAGISGFLNPTGPNSAIEQIQRAIDRDIESQKADIQNKWQSLGYRKGVVAQVYERTGDLYQAGEVARRAALENASKKIGIYASSFEPGSSRAMAAEQMRRAAEAGVAASRAAAEKEAYDRAIVERKFAADERERSRVSGRASADRRAEMAAKGFVPDGRGGWMRDPTAPVDSKFRKEAADAQLAELKASGGPGGNPFAVGDASGQPYRNKDGSVFTIADDNRRSRINEINVAAQNLREMSDLTRELRDEYGGSSEMIGDERYQRLKSIAAMVDFETYKAFGLGAPSAGDTEMAKAARGGKEITSFVHDPTSGLNAYAEQLERKLNTEMRSSGYTGSHVKAPRSERVQAQERTPDQNLDIVKNPLPPSVADAETRSRYLERAKAAASTYGKHSAPTLDEAKKIEAEIRARVVPNKTKLSAEEIAAGKLTSSEAAELIGPIMRGAAKKGGD